MAKLQNSSGRLTNAKVAQSQNFNMEKLLMASGQGAAAAANFGTKTDGRYGKAPMIGSINQSMLKQQANGSAYMVQQGFQSPSAYPSHGHPTSHHMPPMHNATLSSSINAGRVAGGVMPGGKYVSKNAGRAPGALELGTTRYAPRSLDKYAIEANQQRQHHRGAPLESISSRLHSYKNGLVGQSGQEQKTSDGNIIALACGPLKGQRYINKKIEAELVDFKKEIEEKFGKSELRQFKFPRRQPKLPDPMRSTRQAAAANGGSSERGAAPGIGAAANSTRTRHVNQSSFVSYQNEQLQARPQYNQNSESPKRHGVQAHQVGGKHAAEQSRYNDIMRSINNTEQFIKAKQAIAAHERKAGRNQKKGLHATDLQAIANSTNSSLMQTQYTKNPFEQPVMIGAMAQMVGHKNNGKVKVKLGQSPEKSRNEQHVQSHLDPKLSPGRTNKIHKQPKSHINSGLETYGGTASNLRETIAKFNKNTRVDQSLQLHNYGGLQETSHSKLNIPKIVSPHHGGAVSQSISNFESLKNQNTKVPKIKHSRQASNEMSTNLRGVDRSLNLKMNYENYRGIPQNQVPANSYTNGSRPPPIPPNLKQKKTERDQQQQRIFSTYIDGGSAVNSNASLYQSQGNKQSHISATNVKKSRYAPPISGAYTHNDGSPRQLPDRSSHLQLFSQNISK